MRIINRQKQEVDLDLNKITNRMRNAVNYCEDLIGELDPDIISKLFPNLVGAWSEYIPLQPFPFDKSNCIAVAVYLPP